MRSPAFVVADGFASSTLATTVPRYEHLSVALGKTIVEAVPGAHVSAFSYADPGYAYEPADTNITVGVASNRLVDPYMPQPRIAVTSICFSLSSPLFILGLDAWRSRRAAVDDASADSGNKLVLFQPALGLTEAVRRAIASAGWVSLQPIRQLVQVGPVLRDRLFAAIDRVADEVDVTIVHWPGDEFIDYSPATMSRLRDANVSVVELPPPRDPDGRLVSETTTDPFLSHAAVGPDREAHRRIAELCRSDEQSANPHDEP